MNQSNLEFTLAAVAAVDARKRIGGDGNARTNADMENHSTISGSTSWAFSRQEFEAIADRNRWVARQNATYILAILLEQPADILPSVPT